jgi:hypothetical protein
MAVWWEDTAVVVLAHESRAQSRDALWGDMRIQPC